MPQKNLLLNKNTTDHNPISYSLACGIDTIERATIANLTMRGFVFLPDAQRNLIIDAPTGFALHTLQARRVSSASYIHVVITWNSCAEYWEDLWDLQPMVLVAGDMKDIPMALTMSMALIPHRFTPYEPSQLTESERRIFRLLAQGQSNQQIADSLMVRCQSVRNTLTTIYQKLGLRDRSEALLYYWGIWPFRQHLYDEK